MAHDGAAVDLREAVPRAHGRWGSDQVDVRYVLLAWVPARPGGVTLRDRIWGLGAWHDLGSCLEDRDIPAGAQREAYFAAGSGVPGGRRCCGSGGNDVPAVLCERQRHLVRPARVGGGGPDVAVSFQAGERVSFALFSSTDSTSHAAENMPLVAKLALGRRGRAGANVGTSVTGQGCLAGARLRQRVSRWP